MCTSVSAQNEEEDYIVLENERIALAIGADDGAIQSIYDKNLDIHYELKGLAFEISTNDVTIKGLTPKDVQQNPERIILNFETPDFTIDLVYSLDAQDGFVEKWIEIKEKENKAYFIKNVILENTVLGKAFNEIHFHDDNTIWQCPINLFLRGEKGGCFAGLEYPYWKLDIKEHKGFSLGFSPNYQVSTGESFVSEKYFMGTFRREGIHRYSQGPYPGEAPTPYLGFSGGLHQHFKDNTIPAAAVKAEILDWGEVWAMQEFMARIFPDDLPLPEEGYWIWQNGWWAGLWDPKTEILDNLKQAGVHDIMTAHTWYGRGNHPLNPPYLAQMQVEPLGFPKDSGIAGMPGPAGPAAGLHVKHENVSLDKFTPNKFTPDFLAPPAMEEFYKYGQEIGVYVSSFSVPGLYFDNHPEWASIDENGKVTEYLFGAQVDCPASDEYMDHTLNILDHVFTKYKPRWWGFDGRWMSYWEVPAYRPGEDGLGIDPCYAENHGHLPGDNLYKEWKNILNLLQELRLRHPNVCLEQYYGLKRGEPWAMRYFNSADNYYESNGAVMNRFQTWHNQNDRFRPVYKNYAAIFGDNSKDFRINVLSSISSTAYCQIGPGYKMLPQEENRQFLNKWRTWATQNYKYLKVKRDLFDSPGIKPIDGSAHIIKDRGFIFLFAPDHEGKTVRASIPINRWIQLEENPDALYQIKEVYPREGKVLATVRYGDELLYDMPKNSAVVLALEPAPKGSKVSQTIAADQEVQLVPAFSSIIK